MKESRWSSSIALFAALAMPGRLPAQEDAGGELPRVQVQVGLCDTTGMRLDQIEEIQEESAALFLPAAVELVWWDAPESCSEPPPENGLPFVQVYVLGELLPSIRELYPSHQAARILGVTLGKAGNVPGSVIHLSKTAVNTMARLPSGNVVSRTLTRA
ncbi:MAG TPA: hypothetical protein VGC53_14925, partial [Vicinamibacteria bacterium]